VLVDRIWPRGLRKEDAHLDEWLRAIAPSTELRRWYGHDPERFMEFRRRYLAELRDPEHREALHGLRELATSRHLTLLTATRDLGHSHAAVLAERLGRASGAPAVAADRAAGSLEDTADQVSQLLNEHGRTYADEAGITLRDKPSPLYQLLVLAVLCSTRIRADIATHAARELFRARLRTARTMAATDWQTVVDGLGRAHYRRYDESTATALLKGAELLLRRWRGDLRLLRKEADGDPGRIRELLQEVPRIGPVGADIFCREAQGLWPELRPFFDNRALATAQALRLPATAAGLAGLVAPGELPRLAAALVRVGLEH
jgi:uncharacterized protein YeaO (DUF488 family)